MGKINDQLISDLSVYFLRRSGTASVEGNVDFTTFTTITITQSVSVSYNSAYCYYTVNNGLASVFAKLNVTGTGTTNNAITLGGIPTAILPINYGSDSHLIGRGFITDTMNQYAGGNVVAVGQSDWRFIQNGLGNYCGITPNFGLANGDFITLNLAYRVS